MAEPHPFITNTRALDIWESDEMQHLWPTILDMTLRLAGEDHALTTAELVASSNYDNVPWYNCDKDMYRYVDPIGVTDHYKLVGHNITKNKVLGWGKVLVADRLYCRRYHTTTKYEDINWVTWCPKLYLKPHQVFLFSHVTIDRLLDNPIHCRSTYEYYGYNLYGPCPTVCPHTRLPTQVVRNVPYINYLIHTEDSNLFDMFHKEMTYCAELMGEVPPPPRNVLTKQHIADWLKVHVRFDIDWELENDDFNNDIDWTDEDE